MYVVVGRVWQEVARKRYITVRNNQCLDLWSLIKVVAHERGRPRQVLLYVNCVWGHVLVRFFVWLQKKSAVYF